MTELPNLMAGYFAEVQVPSAVKGGIWHSVFLFCFVFLNEMTEGKMAGSEIKDLLSFLVLN